MYRFRASEGPITVASTSRNTQPSVYIIPFFIYESVSWVFLQSILPYHRSSSDFIFRVGLPNLVSKTVLCFSKSSVVAKLDAKDSRSPVQGHDWMISTNMAASELVATLLHSLCSSARDHREVWLDLSWNLAAWQHGSSKLCFSFSRINGNKLHDVFAASRILMWAAPSWCCG
jgi:hypothetical protein